MKITCIAILPFFGSILADRLVSIPFKSAQKNTYANALGIKKLGRLVDVPLENIDLAYLVDLAVGSPPQNFTLLLDTGSSSTWVPIEGCGRLCGFPRNSLKPYLSSTFKKGDLRFQIRYGDGFAKGFYASDTVHINGISVPSFNIAVSDSNDGELTDSGADGILGIGPDQLSMFSNTEKRIMPTLVTSMYDQNIVDHNVFSVYFQPVSKDDVKSRHINGELVFGGVDPKHIKSEVTYSPITQNRKFNDYWAVDVSKIAVGDFTKSYDKGITAIVDTGSTLLYLPRDIIRKVFDGVDGMNRDYNGDYTVPCESKNLPDITLHMGENSYTIKPEHYVIRAGALSRSDEMCTTYLQESPVFVDAILGYAFLQTHVSVFDNDKHQIGFAMRA